MVQYRWSAALAVSDEAAGCMPRNYTMAIYQHYAPFYDGSGQIRFAALMGQYLREVLTRHPVADRRALDLACGTGTLALILADDGWEVVGLDSSAPMLAIARARAADVPSGRV